MISRQHRFHGYNSLNYVYRQGATVRDYYMSLRFIRNPRRSTHRVAVIVSRKVHKSAVQRNKIRRRLYEIVRLHEAAITGPFDVVVTVFSDQLAVMPAEKLSKSLVELCKKAGILSSADHLPSSGHGIVTRERG